MNYLLLTTFLFSLAAFAQNEAPYDGTTPLSAEEIEMSENYTHEGRNQRIADEACENNEFSDLCTNDRTAFKDEGAQKLEQIMPIVSKVYATVVGATKMTYYDKSARDGIKANRNQAAKDGKTISNKEARTGDGEGKEKQDYCGLIAGGVEAASAVMAQLKGQKTQENLENSNSNSRQANSFYALADTHKDLRNTTRIQMGGWGATAACYATMMATGSINPQAFSSIAKLSGSVIMGTFYGIKQKYHNKRYEELKALGDKLPKMGDCNPATETTCFCSEESSQTGDPANYQKYCVPEILANRPGDPSVCITASGNADPNCNCKLTNSCITHKVGELGLELGFNGSQIQGLVDGLKPYGNGFAGGNFAKSSDKNMAFAKKQLAKAPKATEDPNLTDDQKKLALVASKLGVPKSVAAGLAKLPGSSLPANVSSIDPTLSKSKKGSISYANKPGYKKGRSAGSKKSSSSSSRFNPFARSKKSNTSSTGIEVDDYIAKAQREAEITKDTSKPIFDIISYRYKKSAWREFKSSFEEEKEKVQK